MASGNSILAAAIAFSLISLVLYIVGVATPEFVSVDSSISGTNETVAVHVGYGLFQTCVSFFGCDDVNYLSRGIRVLYVLGLVNIGLGVLAQFYFVYRIPTPYSIGKRRAQRRSLTFPILSFIFGVAAMARTVAENPSGSYQLSSTEVDTYYYGYSFGCGTAAWVFALFSATAFMIAIHTGPSTPPPAANG